MESQQLRMMRDVMVNVLVVDDSAMDRCLAGRLLEKNSDWNVNYAQNGVEALESFANQIPDIVITDLQMPEMNGLELVQAIKAQYPLTPVILMTAKGNEQIAVEALQQGAASYVPKRALSRDLSETVGRVLSATQEQREQARLVGQMSNCRFEFEMESDFGMIASLTGYLQRVLREMSICEEHDLVRVGIALEEALVNAVYHGNLEVSSKLREVDHKQYYDLARQRLKEDPFQSRRTYVTAEFNRTGAHYSIRDEGPGFDPLELPDPTDPANLDRPCGRGVLLMRTFMDEVKFNETGNQVQMIKRASNGSAAILHN